MANDFGNSLSTATPIPTNRIKPFSNSIGGSDRRDFLKITLSTHSSIDVTLSRFKGNIRFALLDDSGNVLQTAVKSGKKKLINTVLDAGNYGFRLVGNANDTTRYRLKINSAPANTGPTVATNTGVGLNRGGVATLNGSLLKVIDTQQSAAQLVYTLTGKPTAGQLKLNGNTLGVGSTFTQDDLDTGRVSYTSRSSVNQLTQNTFDDGGEGFFAVSQEAIAWSTYDGVDSDVYLFDGTTTRPPLTDTPGSEFVSDIQGKQVAWFGEGGTDGGSDLEIFLYDGSTIRQLTTNAVVDLSPKISGSNVTWYGEGGSDGGNDYEIFFYNGTSTLQLSENSTVDVNPIVSGSNVIWYGSGGSDGGLDNEIFFYNGTSTQQLTVNAGNDGDLTIDGGNAAWAGQGGIDGGTDQEIFFYNGTSIQQLTQNSVNDSRPNILGSTVVWNGRGGTDGGSDYEIFLYDGSSTRQLTTDANDDNRPVISGSSVIWYGTGGSDGGTDAEIFFYDGSSTRQLTQNDTGDFIPQIAGDLYAWVGVGGADGGTDVELFYGSTVNSDRFSFTVADGVGGSTAGSFVFNIT